MALHCLYRAVADENIEIGHVSLTWDTGLPDTWYVHEVLVAPDFRGTGWGRMLFGQACRDADADGVTLVGSAQANDPSMQDSYWNFYLSFGCEPVEHERWNLRRLPRG